MPGSDAMGSAPRRLRIVVLAPVLPTQYAGDAGTRYMQLLREHIEDRAELHFLVPSSDVVRAVDPVHAPEHRVLGGRPDRPTSVLEWLHHRVARIDPSTPYLPFVFALLARDQRSLLRDADVVDLQWEEFIRLAWLVKRFAPRAIVIGTFHDVLSQRYERVLRNAGRRRRRLRWWVARQLASRHEVTAMRRLDIALAFAQKDIDLLPSGAQVEVIYPPMAVDTGPHVSLAETRPVVIFVGYLGRLENQDAVHWMLSEIWPHVRSEVPGALFRVIGRGCPPELEHLLSREDAVEFAGFVEDLASEYAAARACAVPLRLGAGVKFKVIEAMAAGVPVVSTTVGAEGIGGREQFVAVSDDAATLARALVRALTSPDDTRAAATRSWALDRYGIATFHHHLDGLYLKRGGQA